MMLEEIRPSQLVVGEYFVRLVLERDEIDLYRGLLDYVRELETTFEKMDPEPFAQTSP